MRLTTAFPTRRANGVSSTTRFGIGALLRGSADAGASSPIRVNGVTVLLDGSVEAEHALPFAIAIARRSGTLLRVMHLGNAGCSALARLRSDDSRTLRRDRRLRAKAYLREVRRRIVTSAGDVVAAFHVIEPGDWSRASPLALTRADLVVVATRKRGWMDRLRLRESALRWVTELSCPVLFVRGDKSPVDLTEAKLPRHLVIPLDGRRDSESIFRPAAELAGACEAACTFLHVDDPDDLGERFPHSDAWSYLRYKKREAADVLPDVAVKVIDCKSSVVREILDCAKETDGAVIAVATRRRHRMLFRGVVEKLVDAGTAPVLVVKADGES